MRFRVRDLHALERLGHVLPLDREQGRGDRQAMGDDQQVRFGAREERLVCGAVPGDRVDAALAAAGDRIGERVRALPEAQVLDRTSLELTHTDVVEVRDDQTRDRPALERDVRRLARSREARGDAEVDRLVAKPLPEGLRLPASGARERVVVIRVAVQQTLGARRALAVPNEDRPVHAGRVAHAGRRRSAYRSTSRNPRRRYTGSPSGLADSTASVAPVAKPSWTARAVTAAP